MIEAFAKYGRPKIVNTDQGSQFTAQVFVDAVKSRGCQLAMDGRGAWRDNVFVERLWKSIKYEEVFLHAYDTALLPRRGSTATSISTTASGRIQDLVKSKPLRHMRPSQRAQH